jgi:hypothetical protein
MPDGKRKRRFSENRARRAWYAYSRSSRFRRRFGLCDAPYGPVLVAGSRQLD